MTRLVDILMAQWSASAEVRKVVAGESSVTVSDGGTITDVTAQKDIGEHLPININGALYYFCNEDSGTITYVGATAEDDELTFYVAAIDSQTYEVSLQAFTLPVGVSEATTEEMEEILALLT